MQFTMAKIMEPRIREQLKKVEVVADPEIEKVFPALQRVIVNITTTDGRMLSKQLDFPKGDPRNPLTDQEVEEKFAALADGVLSTGAQKKLKEAIWNLEDSESVCKLMALMKADAQKQKTPVRDRRAHRKIESQREASKAGFGLDRKQLRALRIAWSALWLRPSLKKSRRPT